MKKFCLILMVLACFVGTAQAGNLTYNEANYKKHLATVRTAGQNDPLMNFINEVDTIFSGTATVGITNILFASETDTPTATEGRLYYNATLEAMVLRTSDGWSTLQAGGDFASLDEAYNGGSAIEIDNGAVTMTATNAANNVALAIVQADTGATVGQTITSAGTGALLSFDSNGTGADVLGSDSTWTITKAGAATLVGITNTGAIAHSTADITITGTAANIIFDISDDELIFNDDAVLSLGTGADITVTYDGSDLLIEAAAADDVVKLGATTNFDVIVYGDTVTDLITFDTSAEDVQFDGFDLTIEDADLINFGDADDVTMSFDATNFEIFALAADTPLVIGGITAGFDVTYAFEGAGQLRTDYDADFVNLTDDMDLRFGTGASANGDFQISSSSANLLTIGQIVAGTGSIAVGVDDAGLDVKMYGDTASAYWLWDTSADTMTVVGGNATITTDDTEADQFKVDATGAIVGDAINLETTDGGIMLNADGGSNGDIELNAADDLIFTAAGAVTITNTSVLTISGGATVTGVTTIATGIVTPSEIVATTNAIEITESGTVFILNHATEFASTLPTVASSAGVTFRFIVGAVPSGADYTILTDSLEDKISGSVTVNGAAVAADGPDDTITFTRDAAAIGDWCELTSDGVGWYLSGQAVAATGIVPSKAD